MTLRSSKVLKFFSILLFSFELIAPSFGDSAAGRKEFSNGKAWFVAAGCHTIFLNLFLFEVTNSGQGEKEAKDHKQVFFLADFSFIVTFEELTSAQPQQGNWAQPKDGFNTTPALFALYGALLI